MTVPRSADWWLPTLSPLTYVDRVRLRVADLAQRESRNTRTPTTSPFRGSSPVNDPRPERLLRGRTFRDSSRTAPNDLPRMTLRALL